MNDRERSDQARIRRGKIKIVVGLSIFLLLIFTTCQMAPLYYGHGMTP
jgi:hypothetical protein